MLYQIQLKCCLMTTLVSQSVYKAPDSWQMVKNIYTFFLLTVQKKKKKSVLPVLSVLSFGNQFSSSLHSIQLPLTQISLIIGVRHRTKCFKDIFLFNLLDNPGRQWGGGHCWFPTRHIQSGFSWNTEMHVAHVTEGQPIPSPAPGVGSDWSKLGNPVLLPMIGSGNQA